MQILYAPSLCVIVSSGLHWLADELLSLVTNISVAKTQIINNHPKVRLAAHIDLRFGSFANLENHMVIGLHKMSIALIAVVLIILKGSDIISCS